MRLRNKKRALVSLVAVAVFMFSMAYAGTTVAIPYTSASDSTRSYTLTQDSNSGYTPAMQDPENGTDVWWQQDANSTSDTWTWDNKNWLFGPSPSFEIFHENGTLLTSDSYAEINEVLRFVVTIPKNVFSGGAGLGAARFNGWYRTSNYNFSADFGFSYENWEYAYEHWNANSWQYNYTEEMGPPLPPFVDILPGQCSNSSDSTAYYLTFAVRFTSETPLGLYELNLNIEDTENNWIGTYNFGSTWEFQGIAVGMQADLAWDFSYGGGYTLQKLDLEGDILYSVSRNKDFIMRFNVSGDEPAWVQMGFWMPSYLDLLVNVTGWHQELGTTYGGWEFDDILQTYVWNDTIPVTQFEEVYGEYQQKQWTEIGTYSDVNVTVLREEWNETTFTWDRWLEEETHYIEKQLYFIYNQSIGSFETVFGYQTYAYPHETIIPDTWNEEILVIEPMPQEFPIFYELNTTASSAGNAGKDFVVEFVGHFTDNMPVTGEFEQFSFNTQVMGPDGWFYYPDTFGERPRQTPQEFELATRISIDTPVTIAKLLLEDGTEPMGWMFQADKGENFQVSGRLQGGGALSSDIDGVSFKLHAYDSFWTEEENTWSQLTYIVELDMNGNPSIKAFNWTEKNNYTFSSYMDYVWSNFTGWHYEYNESTGVWDWLYGEYWEWAWMEVDGWHWEWWQYNQKSGEWQNEYVNPFGPEAVVSADFGTVSGFNKWVDDGDLYVTFLMNMSQSAPDTSYWWEFAFMNNTWYEDYSQDYGEHEILTWEREWVYSFDYLGDKVYVDPFVQNQPGYYNDTLSLDPMIGLETPYITLDGVDYPIKVRENYDPYSSETWKTMFYYDHYDPETNKDHYYYELENGTRIDVSYSDTMYIFNVTTFTGDTFLTAMEWEWVWNDLGTDYFYWIDIDGVIHQGGPEYQKHNLAVFEFVDKVEVSYMDEGWYVRYGLKHMLNIVNFWWESRDMMYYMTDIDGNLYMFYYDEYVTYNFMGFIDGAWQVMSWPEHYFIADYLGSDAVLASYNIRRSWYHEDGAVKHEMPYPGANAEWQHDLERTMTEGGKVPTTKSLIYNDKIYPVYNVTAIDWVVDILGTIYTLNEYFGMYTTVNGTAIWDAIPVGFRSRIGTFDNSLAFNHVEDVDYMTPDMMGHPRWDGILQTNVLDLLNGTTWVLNDTYVFRVFEYEIDSKTFYSAREWPEYWESANDSWYEYLVINGTSIVVPSYESLPKLKTFVVKAFDNVSNYIFDFMGSDYPMDYNTMYNFAFYVNNATYSGDLYFWMGEGAQPIYGFNYLGTPVTAVANHEMVNRLRMRWGNAMVYGLSPIQSAVYMNFHELIIGMPEWGMWGVQNWAADPDTGALDLDGNFDTKDDQYYVQEEYSSTDSWTHVWDRMDVNVRWDPNATAWGDEMNINSWLGVDTFTWSYEWSQAFYWYYADTMAQLNTAEMQAVKDTLLTAENKSMPGYWDISRMARNVTWADILAEAQANGWDWMTSNEQTWTWLSFGINQNFGTSVEEGEVEHWLEIGMHYEFSGLMVWEDLNDNDLMDVNLENPGIGELTHYLIPDSVGSVSFVTPGQSFGNTNPVDSIHVDIDDEVTWGVTFTDVNGTVFPYTLYGYWGWYDSVVSGSDLRTFDERPTKVNIDEISFLIHFQGYVNTTEGALNNYAEIKVDNYVGNWDVDLIGGRDNLENRSLALNYFAEVHMSDFSFKANGSFADSESTVSAETFEFETAGAQFAEMIMGGVTYDWGKNTSAPYDVLSYSTPVGTFRQAFESESGQSAAAWAFSTSMFYVTIGFPEWEGYSVYQDPVFVGYTSALGTTAGPGGPVQFGAFALNPTVPTESDSVQIGVDVYSTEMISGATLYYSDNLEADIEGWGQSEMWEDRPGHWVGDVPPYPDETEVFFLVVVHGEFDSYSSEMQSYIVGQGLVGPTGPTGPTGPGGEFGPLSTEMLILLIGGAAVVVVIAVLAKRRNR